MKIIKKNIDGTTNILNPSNYYVAKIAWLHRTPNETDFWQCTHVGREYSFYLHNVSYNHIREMAWSHKELQKCIEQCLGAFDDGRCDSRYLGTLYQFDNEQEFLDSHQAGLL